MQITKELDLTNFDFWAGAKEQKFSYSELKELEHTIEELYSNGATETQINDLFWFEEEFLCSLIDLNFEEYLER